jgi:dipeptidyl aminopeptidase/acylaminoacyl peptidase
VVRVDPEDVLTRTADLPDAVVRYAGHADGLIDVHLPARHSGTRPLVVLLHGGFWRAAYDRVPTRPLANALAADGFVVATPEYRRVGGPGDLAGGWPTTFDDISAAMDALPGLLAALGVRCDAVTVVGHSAGGHLALWLANQGQRVDRIVALAPVGDLREAVAKNTGRGATQDLLGGTPTDVPERYDAADPATRLVQRPSCEVVIVHGVDDQDVPVQNSRGLANRFPFIELRELEGIEHYGLIDPRSRAWPVVRAAIRGG